MECKNCKQSLKAQDNFCPICGQQNISKLDIKFVLGEVFQTLFNLDSKVFRSLKFLILKPGFLTQEYLAGKRVSYLPPIRIYIVLSFLFFFLSAVFDFNQNKDSNVSINSIEVNSVTQDGAIQKDSISNGVTFFLGGKDVVIPIADLKKWKYEGTLANALDSLTSEMPKVEAYLARKLVLIEIDDKKFVDVLLDQLSLFLMLFLPFFALLYGFIFRKSKKGFIGHLLFNIHLNSFIIFIFLLDLFIDPVLTNYDNINTVWSAALILYLQYYIIKAIMVFYHKKWWIVIFNYVFLLCGYAILGLIFIVLLFFSSIIML